MKAVAYGCGRFGADLVAESGELGLGEMRMCDCMAATADAFLWIFQSTTPMSQVKPHQAFTRKPKPPTKS